MNNWRYFKGLSIYSLVATLRKRGNSAQILNMSSYIQYVEKALINIFFIIL